LIGAIWLALFEISQLPRVIGLLVISAGFLLYWRFLLPEAIRRANIHSILNKKPHP
jgi:hypothetical protein